MPLLPEREHMQLWCPEARVIIVDFGGQRIATPDNPGLEANKVEASPTLNRMDFGAAGLKVPNSCLCFGSRCGAWQWSHWHRGTDNKHYPTREHMKDRDPNMNGVQLGYCGKAAPLSQDMVPPVKPTSLQAPQPANEPEEQKPDEGAPEGETLQ